MSVKRYLQVIIVIILVSSAIAGVAIINYNTELREKAAVPQGSGMIELQPRDLEEGIIANTPMSLKLATPRIATPLDGIQIVATFTGVIPSDLSFSPTTIPQLDFVVNKLEDTANGKRLTLALVTKDPTQPLNLETPQLGTINFTAPATKGTLTITFDPIRSIFAENSSSQDVLATPETFRYFFLGTIKPSPKSSRKPIRSPLPTKKPSTR